MTLSGFSFVRNGVTFDFPFLESISSFLPICEHFILAVGRSEDCTLTRIQRLKSPKIKIIETVWDESQRTGGIVLAQVKQPMKKQDWLEAKQRFVLAKMVTTR